MPIKTIAAVLTVLIVIAGSSGCRNSADDGVSDMPAAAENSFIQTKITSAEWTELQWEVFSCNAFTISVPKGWLVDWNNENDVLSWSVRRPNSICSVSYLEQDFAAKSEETMKTSGLRSFSEKGTAAEYFTELYTSVYEEKYPMTDSYFSAESQCRLSAPDSVIYELPEGRLKDYSSICADLSENGTPGEGVYSAAVFDTGSGVWTLRHIIRQASLPTGIRFSRKYSLRFLTAADINITTKNAPTSAQTVHREVCPM